jgi:hypothetical protein
MKVFACMNCNSFQVKLHIYDIQQTTANWFRSYPTDRKEKEKEKEK